MRKLAILVAVFTLIGCAQNDEGLDNITNIPSKSQTEFYASMPECDTRTYVEDNKYLRWNAGDEITVFAGNSYNGHWQFAGEDGANSGKFNEIDESSFVTGTPLDLTANYAIYPYDENITITEAGVVSLTLPAVQGYNHTYTNTFGEGANTMMAVTESTSDNFLAFKNLCGYLKLKFYGDDVTVKSVTVKGNNGEKIAGKATVSMAYGGEPTITMGDDATDTITIDCGEGVALSNDAANPTIFWVVIPEITFEGGITIEVTDTNDQTFTKATTNAVPIENNLIQPMAALGVEVAPAGPANNEIWYTSSNGSIITPYKTNVFGANIVSNTYDAEKECWVIKFDGEVTSIGEQAFAWCSSLTSVTIPNSVTSIGEGAFRYCDSLTSVTIGNGVTSIGEQAFAWCSSLTSVTIPNSVTSIGEGAFRYCDSLTSVTIGNGVTSIGIEAFYECDSLTSVTIGDSVTTIGNSAFSGCDSLTSVTIPDSVTGIEWYAFQNCTSLTSVTIGNGVTYINGYAFDGCRNLTSVYISDIAAWCNIQFINWGSNPLLYQGNLFLNNELVTDLTIPDSVTKIKNYTFYNLRSLRSVTIPNSVTSIGESAFLYCTSLTSITIPDSVTSIGEYAFSSCSSLTSVTIPDSVTSIGDSAFSSCTSLTSVTIPDSVTSIGYSAFYGCTSLTSVTIGNGVTSIGDMTFADCTSLTAFYGKIASTDNRCLVIDGVLNSFAPAGLSEYDIPDSVTSIGDYAFYGCDSLTSITIPDSVTTIGWWAFRGCTSLKELYCKAISPPVGYEQMFSPNASGRKIYVPAESVAVYKSTKYWSDYATDIVGYYFDNGVVAPIKPATNEIWYTNGSTTSKTVPYTTNAFGANIVSNTYDAEKECWVIKFDGEVTSIGARAFLYCTSLTSITIPDSVTEIGNNAFQDCNSIQEFNGKFASEDGRCLVVDGVLKIVAPANLTSYSIPNSVTSIGNHAFSNCKSLTSITIPDSVTEIRDSAFEYCTSLTSVTIPDSVTSIGEYAFSSCSSLTSVTISDSVTTIGGHAFWGCNSLKSVIIGNNVTTIGEYAFYGCSSLTSVTIPDSVTVIGDYAFYECIRLRSITIGDSVTAIGNRAFYNCYSLTSITIPDSVITVGDYAFYECRSLTSATIGDGVISIGWQVFYACSKLTSVYCEAITPPSIKGTVFYKNASSRKIYVPSASVEAYKTASNWSEYASDIEGYDF